MQIHLKEFAELFAPWAGGSLYCGFSGGADSTAALLVTLRAAQRYGFAVTAVHVNHHLRGEESDREAAAAEAFCRERGVAFQRFDLEWKTGEAPDENALREKRLAIWRKVTHGQAKAAVVLGHHADDAAENLLLKWGRGGNVSSLTAPAETSSVAGVTLLRPLLRYSRAGIEEFLRREGVTRWAVDSSNLEAGHTLRNCLRLKILPQLYRLHPGFREGVYQSLAALRADAECLDRLAAEKAESWRQNCPGGIPVPLWRNELSALRFRLWKLLAGTTEVTAAGMAEFDRFLALPLSPETRRFPVPGGKTAFVKAGRLSFLTEGPQEEALWQWREAPQLQFGSWVFRAALTEGAATGGSDSDEVYFDAAKLPETLRIAPLTAGEKMLPFGRNTAVSVKKLRTDRKVAAFEASPALRLADGRILWAPRVRRSAFFPVPEGGAAVRIRVWYQKKEEI